MRNPKNRLEFRFCTGCESEGRKISRHARMNLMIVWIWFDFFFTIIHIVDEEKYNERRLFMNNIFICQIYPYQRTV